MDLRSLKDEIVRNGFPELLDEDIQVKFEKLQEAFFTSSPMKPDGYLIEVDSALKNASRDIIQGGIAHELAHIVTDKTGKLSLMDRLAEKFSRRHIVLDERNCDLIAIIRGYGRQLLALMEYCEKHGFDYYKTDGLSALELRRILKREPYKGESQKILRKS